MTKLTKTKRALLMTAVDRADGSLLPVARGVRLREGALDRTLEGLIRDGLAETRENVGETKIWRIDPDKGGVGVFVTDAGQVVCTECSGDAEKDKDKERRTRASRSAPRDGQPGGKLREILKAVSRRKGATLDELTEMTGWQPHSARAALTRLRQSGHAVQLSVANGRKAYRLVVGG